MALTILGPGDAPVAGAFNCALINNMPDLAFAATERQFTRLLSRAARRVPLQVRRYSMPGIARSPAVVGRLASDYFPLDHLWSFGADAVMVTGSEPLAARIQDEPYWETMVELLDWSEHHTGTVVASCLAAHAALQHFDGLERVRLPVKRSGLYEQTVAAGHALTAGLPRTTVLPHSRHNDVPSAGLLDHGYDLLMASEQTGWSVASTERHGCRVVLIQGHPEYDADTLLREYRRDLGRFVRGERPDIPTIPAGYLAGRDAERVAAFAASAEAAAEATTTTHTPPDIDAFPFDAIASRLRAPWQRPALGLFDHWISDAGARRLAAASG